MKKILVTGATGYKGSVLVPKLLSQGHHVIAFDLQWFGNHLKQHDNLEIIQGDVRNISDVLLEQVSNIIHLASIANDPCGDLNPKLTWEVSCLATQQLAEQAVRSGVEQFIYASSGSVYGVKEEKDVIETLSLNPISEYNKTKMVAERVLLSYQDNMSVQIVRPATVCGLSPRMRLDVSVNLLTMQALENSTMTVFGGTQTRPNIHIDDITDLYCFFIDNPQHTGIYNAGFENESIQKIAEIIQEVIPSDIVTSPSIDPRSYRINSDKLLATGFMPKKSIRDAIVEIKKAYYTKHLVNDVRWHNLQWMKQESLA